MYRIHTGIVLIAVLLAVAAVGTIIMGRAGYFDSKEPERAARVEEKVAICDWEALEQFSSIEMSVVEEREGRPVIAHCLTNDSNNIGCTRVLPRYSTIRVYLDAMQGTAALACRDDQPLPGELSCTTPNGEIKLKQTPNAFGVGACSFIGRMP